MRPGPIFDKGTQMDLLIPNFHNIFTSTDTFARKTSHFYDFTNGLNMNDSDTRPYDAGYRTPKIAIFEMALRTDLQTDGQTIS